jgi:hypothetical protein
MVTATETKTAIYRPPNKKLPFLVVTLTNGQVTNVLQVASHTEARKVLATRQVKSASQKS